MDTHTYDLPGMQPTLGERLRGSKALIPTMAVLGVTVLALAAALVTNHIQAQSGQPEAQAPAVENPRQEPVRKEPARAAKAAPTTPRNTISYPGVTVARSTAPACANCGVVESVAAVEHQGQVNGIGNSGVGLGAIGGAVVGGILGNQVGGGRGRDAATVLGMAGGAYAGHQIEKNSKRYTTYQMRIRMNDGTLRTVEQSGAIAAGTPVVVEGNSVRVAQQAG